MGCFVQCGKNGMGCYVRVTKISWDVMSRVTKTAWDVLSGAAKVAWDVLSGVTKLHGMFCPGWQIDAGCFVRGVKKWHGMFCPGMFCPTFLKGVKFKLTIVMLSSGSVVHVECLTRDQGAAGSSLTSITALWSLSKTHLS